METSTSSIIKKSPIETTSQHDDTAKSTPSQLQQAQLQQQLPPPTLLLSRDSAASSVRLSPIRREKPVGAKTYSSLVYKSPRKPMSIGSATAADNSHLSPNRPRPMFRRAGGQLQATRVLSTMSPLKCLNNLTDPSPTKKLPTLLRNPFNQPVKRKLVLYSPGKNNANSSSSSSSAMSMRSPNKKTRMLEIDEDANLEPPKMKIASLMSPRKRAKLSNINQCYQNDWTLRTKVRINFEKQCRNWDQCSTSTHKRHRVGAIASIVQESPSKLNDKSISIEAIKNIATVYQHPYLSWQSLYPRQAFEFNTKRDNPFTLTQHSQIAKMMHKDWCESLDDLVNLLVDGKCPYFYMCSDNFNILFKQVPSSAPRRPLVQVYISPFSCGMGCELNKIGVEFKCPDITRSNSSSASVGIERENSQRSFGSQLSQSRSFATLDDTDCCMNSQASRSVQQTKVTSSIDSGNISDFDDDEESGDEENEDTSQFLESIGLSQQDFPSLQAKRKGFIEVDSNTQSKSTSNKPLAAIEGTDNLRKLVKFLQTNRLYTVSNVGKYACIPPTLLSPREFRLSTPQYPEVILSKNMIEVGPQNYETKQKPGATNSKFSTPKKTDTSASTGTKLPIGPTFVELKGTILPNLYKELHKLLILSDNTEHSCLSTKLDSSAPFGTIHSS